MERAYCIPRMTGTKASFGKGIGLKKMKMNNSFGHTGRRPKFCMREGKLGWHQIFDSNIL